MLNTKHAISYFVKARSTNKVCEVFLQRYIFLRIAFVPFIFKGIRPTTLTPEITPITTKHRFGVSGAFCVVVSHTNNTDFTLRYMVM